MTWCEWVVRMQGSKKVGSSSDGNILDDSHEDPHRYLITRSCLPQGDMVWELSILSENNTTLAMSKLWESRCIVSVIHVTYKNIFTESWEELGEAVPSWSSTATRLESRYSLQQPGQYLPTCHWGRWRNSSSSNTSDAEVVSVLHPGTCCDNISFRSDCYKCYNLSHPVSVLSVLLIQAR